MEILYANERGSIRFFGSGDAEGLHIISVSGLDLPEKERTLANYAGQDGVTERTAQYAQRVITIYGDWNWTEISKSYVTHMMQILSEVGTLNISGTEKVRTITANTASFTLGEKKGSYQQFCVQFTCDFPHFTSGGVQTHTLYGRTNQITADRTLPYILTVRASNACVDNTGNVSAEPVFIFYGGKPTAEAGEIIVYNQTTNQTMQIAHTLTDSEIVRLDVPQRTLTSSLHGDITEKIAQDSFFSQMQLVSGENQLRITGEGANVNMRCVLEYQPLYAEAIV